MKLSNNEIALASNFLTVNGRELRVNIIERAGDRRKSVSAEELHYILTLGRTSILSDLRKNFGELPVSVFATRLGNEAQTQGPHSKVFTPKGLMVGGNRVDADDIYESFHGHWTAVLDAGFVPQVIRTHGGKMYGGSWLSFRKPTLQDVMTHWFRQWSMPPDEYVQLRDSIVATQEKAEQRLRVESSINLGRRAITAILRTDSFNASNAQIALILLEADLKNIIGDTVSATDAIKDASNYAYDNDYAPVGAVLAIENSQF